MFTLLMTLRIDLRRGKIRYDEFEVLIKGGASLDLNTCPTKLFRWLNDLSWLNLLELSRIKEFHDVIDRVGGRNLIHSILLFVSFSYKRMNEHLKIGSKKNQSIYPKHMIIYIYFIDFYSSVVSHQIEQYSKHEIIFKIVWE